ncbi:MAG: proline--tRNA ligase [Candidatus Dojkabacteria bacterium]|nr:proline--tRNA ligase [Candidatus Dojkabacteria bacterium]
MKYSRLFGRTIKDVPSDATIASHKFLIQAGFIRESVAGRYFFLPLGQKVMDKFVKIVEEEMAAIDAQKMLIPILQPIELWQETNRDNSGGYELMTVQDRRGAMFTPGGTGEEMFTDVVRKFQISYKDLPIHIYQFGYKFRDELRSKGGLMRTREFLMKDSYIFTENNEQFEIEYKRIVDAYVKIFKRVGLDVEVVPADNGYFGGEYCHEFIIESETGEGKYFVSEDGKYIAHEDIALFKREDVNPEDKVVEFEIFEQPDHVRTMDDNVEFYKLPASRFLKNVVYKNRITGKLIIATIRGDLQVNKNKLEHVLDMVGLLEDATDEDLASFGSKSGYVHSWGYKDYDHVMFVGDTSLRTVKNFIGGQKEETTDSRNVNYGRDFEHEITADIALAEDGFLSEDGSKLIGKKGIEVGSI